VIREIDRSKDEWSQSRGQVWVAWTVFNPLGPTLNCIGAFPEDPNDNSYAIFYRWMHMLGGRSFLIGHIDPSDETSRKAFLGCMLDAFEAPSLPGDPAHPLVSTVPSCVSLGQTPHEQTLVLLDLFKRASEIRKADWGRQRYLLMKYKLDLFARAGEEAREGYEAARRNPENQTGQGAQFLALQRTRFEGIPSFVNWEPNAYQSRSYGDHEFEEWWEAVTSKTYLEAALAQFAHAWVGAAYESGANVPIVEQFEDARDFMAQMNHPLWPSDWTTTSLRKSVRDELHFGD
jgi:hypothetical protein